MLIDLIILPGGDLPGNASPRHAGAHFGLGVPGLDPV